MKRVWFLSLFAAAFFGNCASFSFLSSESSSWTLETEKAKGSVRIVSVSAEKSGEWVSLEKEIRSLLPLLFWEEALLAVSGSENADYSAEVTVREREYTDGWQTRRSLSAEVKIWEGDSRGLPVSAGRELTQGKQSLASSNTLAAMLGKAVQNAVRGLPSKSGTRSPGAEP